jgi:hypothetical protein
MLNLNKVKLAVRHCLRMQHILSCMYTEDYSGAIMVHNVRTSTKTQDSYMDKSISACTDHHTCHLYTQFLSGVPCIQRITCYAPVISHLQAAFNVALAIDDEGYLFGDETGFCQDLQLVFRCKHPRKEMAFEVVI